MNLSSSTLQSGTTYDLSYGGGSQAALAGSGRLTYHARIEAANRPHRFVTSASGPFGLRATMQSEFIPENGGTRASLVIELQWPIPLLGRLIEFVILPPPVVREELDRFKAIAERESQTEPGGQ